MEPLIEELEDEKYTGNVSFILNINKCNSFQRKCDLEYKTRSCKECLSQLKKVTDPNRR
jgi:hypothetical protein